MSVTNPASPMSRTTHTSRWATVSILCFIFFFVAVVIAHFMRPDLSLTRNFVSEYVLGAYGFVLTSALLAIGIGILALTSGLWRSGVATTYARTGLVLLGIGGTAMLLVGIFPVEIQPDLSALSLSGLIHDLATLISFVSTVAGLGLVSSGFRHDLHWRNYYGSAVTMAGLALVALLGVLIIYPLQTGSDPMVPMFAQIIGLLQRALILAIWLWLLVTALPLRVLHVQAIQP